jgi:hypothetical protein
VKSLKVSFQEPGALATSLLQTLTEASRAATEGRGIFAWATASGVRALLDNPDFDDFLRRGTFELWVGTDSITDERAIRALRDAEDRYAGLTVKAVLNDSASLFHPKLTWLSDGSAGSLVVGSGNLTRGGLLNSWEAFTTSRLDVDDLRDLGQSVDDWISTVSPGLVELDDPRVAIAVAGNAGDERAVRQKPDNQVPRPLRSSEYDDWLIAELNKSRKNRAGQSMFSQVSVDQSTFKNFFNYGGGEVEIVLTRVELDGSSGEVESRKGRYKAASVNYYFEVGQVQGLPYPAEGRPIAIFGRLKMGGYVYRVLLPGAPGYVDVAGWLDRNLGAPSREMRRKIVTTDVVEEVWPGNPLVKAATPQL